MKKQRISSPSNFRKPICIFWTMVLFLGFTLSVFAADTQVYKGKLEVPGTSTTSEFLTLDQHGTILENDQVSLEWQNDGNLVVYFYEEEVIWASNTAGKGSILSFQNSDGKLVIKDSYGKIIWTTTGTGGERLQLISNRNLILFNSSGQHVWETNTAITSLSTNDVGEVSANVKSAQDFMIPNSLSSKYLNLRVEGADGGARTPSDFGSPRFKVDGGEGASMYATFIIGTGSNQIPPGSTLRFILGEKGRTRTGQTIAGSPGGGGTGVLLKKPNDADWHLLMVAGGGGGAYSDCCSVKRSGEPAETGESGSAGTNGGGSGGTNGNDGVYKGGLLGGRPGFGVYSGYSGGWYNGRTEENGVYTYHPSVLPTGSPGGQDYTFGFGGGGDGIEGGGGGGGYSGGGGGKEYYGGGGGGSYINAEYASYVAKTQNGTTNSPGDGFVKYEFTNSPPNRTIQLAKYPSKCLDVNGGNTNSGTNIQLWGCNEGAAQNWIFDREMVKFFKDTNKCLEIQGSTPTKGANVELWTCNEGAREQKWIYDGVNKAIRPITNLKYCIDVDGVIGTGNNIQLWTCNGTANQQVVMDHATIADLSGSAQAIRMAIREDRCIDVNGVIGTSNNLQLWSCNGTANQQWTFDDMQIKLKTAPGKCLDLNQSGTGNGTNIQLYDCNGTDAQQWVYDGFTQTFRSKVNTNKCLDISGGNTDKGTNIQLWDCQPGNTNQQFVIN